MELPPLLNVVEYVYPTGCCWNQQRVSVKALRKLWRTVQMQGIIINLDYFRIRTPDLFTYKVICLTLPCLYIWTRISLVPYFPGWPQSKFREAAFSTSSKKPFLFFPCVRYFLFKLSITRATLIKTHVILYYFLDKRTSLINSISSCVSSSISWFCCLPFTMLVFSPVWWFLCVPTFAFEMNC